MPKVLSNIFFNFKGWSSILESVKVNKDIILDEQTILLLELSVRKKIVNDTRGKVNKILNIEEIIEKNNNDIYSF